MKKNVTYFIVIFAFIAISCQSESNAKPKIGDAVLYNYVIKQGDAVVFGSAKQAGDTTAMILEEPSASDPTKRSLMERLQKMAANDTLSFDLADGQKGFLHVYRVILAKDFPKYIEESEKKQRLFEQNLQALGKELNANRPLYLSRRKAAVDSAKVLFEQYVKGQLKDKLTTLNTDNQYFVVKGDGKMQTERKKWVWFHYVTFGPDGKTLIDSYQNLPRGTNVAEFTFNEELEKSVAHFGEGSTIFFSVPAEYQNAPQTGKNVPVLKKSIYWVEVVKVLYF